MTAKGADFSDIQPRNSLGLLDMLTFTPLALTAQGVDTGVIQQVTPNNSFRLGQQIMLWLGVANPADPGTGQFISRIQIKPWWARPNNEFRQAFGGDGSVGAAAPAVPYDTQVFGDGPVVGFPLNDNRYVWVPSQKRLDLTEFITPPPPASPPRHSDSLLLQDLWTMDLQAPTDPAYTGKFSAAQTPCRWISMLYPAFGYALGFTFDATYDNAQAPDVVPLINLSWTVGTFGGDSRIQESIG